MAYLTIKAAHAYSDDGTVSTRFSILQGASSDKGLINLSIDELRKLSALISNALADTATTHQAVATRAYNARRR